MLTFVILLCPLQKSVLTSALVTFLIAARKYLTVAAYERFLVLVSQFKRTVQSVHHGGESWQLEAVLTFLLARKQRGNVRAQLLSTFYYSVWYSSS